jgi:uncharacterized protein YjbJ (UPF0337 family)
MRPVQADIQQTRSTQRLRVREDKCPVTLALLLQNQSAAGSFAEYPQHISEDDMNDGNSDGMPDSDRTEGSIKKMGGDLKEGAGGILGDGKMKREGQADQSEGKLQNAWGSVKDKAREIIGSDEKR